MILLTLLVTIFEFSLSLIIKLYLFHAILMKLIGILILGFIVYCIIKNDFRNTVSFRFPYLYKISTYKDHFINIFFILLYILIFIFGILWLRIRNQERTVDLIGYKEKLLNSIIETSYIENILNLLILLFILFIYIIFVVRINYYFKFQLIRRHLYHIRLSVCDDFEPKGNYEKFLEYLRYYLNLRCSRIFILTIFEIILYPILYIKNYKYLNPILYIKKFAWKSGNYKDFLQLPQIGFKRSLDIFFFILINDNLFKLHYILLTVVFLYDIIFNSLVIKHVYIILPYIFMYQLYCKSSKFVLCRAEYLDRGLASFIYYDVEAFEDHTFKTVLYTYDLFSFQDLIKNYLEKDLQDRQTKEIYFEKKFYSAYINPIKRKLEWRFTQVIRYLEKKNVTTLDFIIILNILLIIQIIINKIC